MSSTLLDQTYELVSLDKLEPHPDNPRKGDLDAISKSIAANGFYGVLVVQKSTGRILIGNHRYQAAKSEGLKQLPVVWVDCDDRAALKLLLSDNKSSDLAGYSEEALAQILLEARAAGDLEGTGYTETDLAQIFKSMGDAILNAQAEEIAEAEVEESEPIPELPEEPVSRLGDLWILGEHRLLCGDSTDSKDVKRLMDGKKAGLMNTDPPYGVSYANDERPNPGVAKPRVAKDDLRDDDLEVFLGQAFSAAKAVLLPTAAWYIWNAYVQCGLYVAAAAAAAAGVHLSREIIWVKPVLLLGRGQYHWKHECAFFGWLEGKHAPPDYGRGKGERDQTTIWEVAGVAQAERKEFNHSTPKPCGLFTVPLIKHLHAGEIAYEPFAGSGPQVIAAEQTKRRCFAMEIEPRFCDVIIQRWEKFTGENAMLDGKERVSFNEVALDRIPKATESAVSDPARDNPSLTDGSSSVAASPQASSNESVGPNKKGKRLPLTTHSAT